MELVRETVGELDFETLVDGQETPEPFNSRSGPDLPGGIKEFEKVVRQVLGIGITQPCVNKRLQIGDRRD